MPQCPLAGLLTGLALMGGLVAPAVAETVWLPTTAVLPPKRPPAQADASVLVQRASQAAPASRAIRSANVAEEASPGALPAVLTAAANATTPVATAPLTERAVLDRANAYFNSIGALVSEFTQIGGDGRRLTGVLYLQRPGKVRFEYASPSTLEVIADGRSVVVRDRKLATQDLYAISQTPLKFLLRDKVNLGTDIKVTEVVTEPGGVRIGLEDRSTLGGTSKILLYFDPSVENLTQWRIADPQGFVTTVVLSNIERPNRVDPNLFVINYERMTDTNR